MKISVRSILLALALGAPAAQLLAAEPLPSVESFFKDPFVRQVRLSPQGHYVAILTGMPDGRQMLAIRDTADLKKVNVPAAGSDQTYITDIHWINENRIGFTVKNRRIEFEGNRDEFAVDRDGSYLTHLISGNWEHHQESTGSNIIDKTLTADYTFHAVTHDGSDDIIVEKYSWNGTDIHPDRSFLYRLNTRTRQLSDVVGKAPPERSQYWLSDAAGVPRIALADDKGRCKASYRSSAGGDWQALYDVDCYSDQRYSPLYFDGDQTLYVSASYHGNNALYRYDLKNMKLASEPMLSIAGFDFLGAPEIDYVSKKIIGFHLEGDATTSVWLDPRMKAIQQKVDALLTRTNNVINCPSDCWNSPVMLVTAASDRQPTQYFLYTPASNGLVGLGGSHPDIKPEQMGLRDFYHYTARDGMSIPVYVTQPPGKASGPRPTVVLVHGGPHVRGVTWDWEAEAQFLASRGYLVIQPEFRGSTGYGYAHFEAGWKQWGLAMQDDLADAAQWAIKQGWSDPKRVAIMGASYGGYATLMGLIKNPEIFRCGVEWAGVTDLHLMFSRSESDVSVDDLHYGMRTLIGDPDQDSAQFDANSPLLNAAKLKQPLLIAHGAADMRVPIVHATKFHDAVSRTNAQVEWIVYSDEGHGWRHEEDNIDFWNHVEAFLDKNLKTVQ